MPDPKPGLWGVVRRLPTDYSDFGGDVVRWADGDNYPDCSSGCRWARWLKGALGSDWCVCANPASPRAGLLTFEHQAGRGCFQAKGKRPRKPERGSLDQQGNHHQERLRGLGEA